MDHVSLDTLAIVLNDVMYFVNIKRVTMQLSTLISESKDFDDNNVYTYIFANKDNIIWWLKLDSIIICIYALKTAWLTFNETNPACESHAGVYVGWYHTILYIAWGEFRFIHPGLWWSYFSILDDVGNPTNQASIRECLYGRSQIPDDEVINSSPGCYLGSGWDGPSGRFTEHTDKIIPLFLKPVGWVNCT